LGKRTIIPDFEARKRKRHLLRDNRGGVGQRTEKEGFTTGHQMTEEGSSAHGREPLFAKRKKRGKTKKKR